MERRLPSDCLLTWLLGHLDPLRFGGPVRQAVLAGADPRAFAARSLPLLAADFADVDPAECDCEPPAFVDDRAGEMGSADAVDHRSG